jgi:hypothetical protein
MPRPYTDPVEIITGPVPAQSPFIPVDAKIVVGAVAPASPDPIPIVLLPDSTTDARMAAPELAYRQVAAVVDVKLSLRGSERTPPRRPKLQAATSNFSLAPRGNLQQAPETTKSTGDSRKSH